MLVHLWNGVENSTARVEFSTPFHKKIPSADSIDEAGGTVCKFLGAIKFSTIVQISEIAQWTIRENFDCSNRPKFSTPFIFCAA